MNKLKAFFIRIFCDTITIYKEDHNLKLNDDYFNKMEDAFNNITAVKQ